MNALLYLTLCTTLNRFRARFRRLKEPRYLIGLMVGLGYFWTMFLRPRPRFGPPPGAVNAMSPSRAPIELAFAVLIFLVCAMAWIPGRRKRPALHFTQADVQFLFPAPFTRTELIHYKLLRSQLSSLVGSAFMTMVFRPSGLASNWMFFAGMWLAMTIFSLHLTGISLSRESLGSHGLSGIARQWLPIAVVSGAVAILVGTVARDWLTLSALNVLDGIGELARILSMGAASMVLWPFRTVVRLPLAATSGDFLRALPWALGIMALNYIWVIRSDARFEEASAELAEKFARIKKGQRLSAPKIKSTQGMPFALSLEGRAEMAIFWKNLIMTGRYVSLRTLLRFVPVLVIISVIAKGAAIGQGLAVVSGTVFVITLLLGSHLARNDLRRDLSNLVVLKAWPVSGATLVRGEVMAPAAILTVIAWLAIIGGFFSMPGGRIQPSWMLAAALLSPGVILIQLLMQNAIAVIWPSWVVISPGMGPRGIDVMGQRLIMLAGFLLVLLVAVLPTAIVGGLVGLVIYVLTRHISVIVPAIVGAMVLLIEAFVASEAIGRMLDRTDISAVDAQE